MEEIENNDYNLNIPRYVDTSEAEPEIDINEVFKEISEIDKELENCASELEGYFKELGIECPIRLI